MTLLPLLKTKTPYFFNGSRYNTNDGQPTMRKDKTMLVMGPKGRGAGLKVSDLIDKRDGYVAIPNTLYETLLYRKIAHLFYNQ